MQSADPLFHGERKAKRELQRAVELAARTTLRNAAGSQQRLVDERSFTATGFRLSTTTDRQLFENGEPPMNNFRNPNTNRGGSRFDEATKVAVWNKATIISGVDPRVRRKDVCGAWIDWAKYGDTSHHGTGLEIDHIQPVAEDGTDDLVNLQPLQWENNRSKGDDYPARAFCAVAAK